MMIDHEDEVTLFKGEMDTARVVSTLCFIADKIHDAGDSEELEAEASVSFDGGITTYRFTCERI